MPPNFLFQSLPVFDDIYDDNFLKFIDSDCDVDVILDLLDDDDDTIDWEEEEEQKDKNEFLFPIEEEFESKGLTTLEFDSDGFLVEDSQSSIFKHWYVPTNTKKYNRVFFNINSIIFDHSSHNLQIVSSCGLKSNFFLSPFEFFGFGDLPISFCSDFFYYNRLSKLNFGYPFRSLTSKYVWENIRYNCFRIGKIGALESTYVPLFNSFFFDDSDSSSILLSLHSDFFGGFCLSSSFFSNYFSSDFIKKEEKSFFIKSNFLPFFSFGISPICFSLERFFYNNIFNFSHETLAGFLKKSLFLNKGFIYLPVSNSRSLLKKRKKRFFSFFTDFAIPGLSELFYDEESDDIFYFNRKFPFFFDNMLFYRNIVGPCIHPFFLGSNVDLTLYLDDLFEADFISGNFNRPYFNDFSLSWFYIFSNGLFLLSFFREKFPFLYNLNGFSFDKFFLRALTVDLCSLYDILSHTESNYLIDIEDDATFLEYFSDKDLLWEREVFSLNNFSFVNSFNSVEFFCNFYSSLSLKSNSAFFLNVLNPFKLNIDSLAICSDFFFEPKFFSEALNSFNSKNWLWFNLISNDFFKFFFSFFKLLKYREFVDNLLLHKSIFLSMFYSFIFKSRPLNFAVSLFVSLKKRLGIVSQILKGFFEEDYLLLKNHAKFNLAYFFWFLLNNSSLFEKELRSCINAPFFLKVRLCLFEYFFEKIDGHLNLETVELSYSQCISIFTFFYFHYIVYYRVVFNLLFLKAENNSRLSFDDFLAAFVKVNNDLDKSLTSGNLSLDVILNRAIDTVLDKTSHSLKGKSTAGQNASINMLKSKREKFKDFNSNINRKQFKQLK